MSDFAVLDHKIAWGVMTVVSFLIGSVPVGYLIGRARGIDVRRHGSGNIGATNVGRVLGRRAAAMCLTLDVLKGFVPTLAAGLATGSILSIVPTPSQGAAWMAVASAAILGHMYTPWLRFRGGKGVATGLGALLGMFPILTLAGALGLLVWVISVRITRYVGVSSCLAAVSVPLWVYAAGIAAVHLGMITARRPSAATLAAERLWPILIVSGAIALLVIFKHRGNLARTWAGTESRVRRRAPARPAPPVRQQGG